MVLATALEAVTEFHDDWVADGTGVLRLSSPAVAVSVPNTRAAVAEYAARAGATSEQLDAVRLAVSEAVTNVVKHAYHGQSGQVYLTAIVVQDELWVLVADDGCGHHFRSAEPGLGFGLRLMASCCSQVLLTERAGGGTEVRMRFPITASARCGPEGGVRLRDEQPLRSGERCSPP